MKKTMILLLLLFCLCVSKPAYAIYDFLAKVEEVIELGMDYKTQIEDYQNQLLEAKKRAVQGFKTVGGCIANPLNCDLDALTSLTMDSISAIQKRSSAVMVMPNSGLDNINFGEYGDEGIINKISEAYVYERGSGEDLKNLDDYAQHINGIIISDTNALFAKASTTLHSIKIEEQDNSLYQMDFGGESSENGPNIEKILRAQATVVLYTQYRLAHILELRANMVGGESTVGLIQQSRENEE